MAAGEPLLRVSELSVTFPSREGDVIAVERLSLEVFPDEVLGIVGESGSGKSVTSLSILRVLPKHSRIDGGTIVFRDGDTEIELAQASADGPEVRSVRGRRISMIFQEPMSAFSPLHTIGNQIGEAVALHNLPPDLKRSARNAEVRRQTLDLLTWVGMPNPEQLIDSYPHELSGGMRQRALIAMGLACHPDILIADEPTTALDVTLQSQVVALLSRLVFDFAIWSREEKTRPILLVCEEAHRYVPSEKNADGSSVGKILSRIAKEGRKYGVSLGLITQRPSDLAEGVLSQCGTIIAMRLNNDRDQAFVRAAMPEGARGFLDSIPALRNRECIVCGEGVSIPIRASFDALAEEKRPASADPSFVELWSLTGGEEEIVERTVQRWRAQGR